MDKSRLVFLAVIVALVVVVAIGSRVASSTSQTALPKVTETGARLLKASSKWSVVAEETKSPLLSLIHVETAKAYVNALRDLMTDAECISHFRSDPKKMLQSLEKREQKLLRKISAAAPGIIPEGEHIARTGWV